MWLFLGTEILFFGGLFCYYAVYRAQHPEIFEYGAQFLNTWLGGANTMVLILSSMTMAAGVTFAQRGQTRRLAVALSLTLAGALTFMVIKYFEYSHKFHENLVWGPAFYERPIHDEASAAESSSFAAERTEAAVAAFVADAGRGQELWMGTCRSCHGVGGEGITGQGKDIRGSEFIASKADDELLAFVKVGRMPFDSMNTTGLQMPPRGGNPLLKDDDLKHIIAFVRTFRAPVAAAMDGASEEGGTATNGALLADGTHASQGPFSPDEVASHQSAPKEDIYIFKSVVPAASRGQSGLNPSIIYADAALTDARDPSAAFATSPDFWNGDPAALEAEAIPRDAHIFFNAYFMLTGLHGIHVLAGMGVITWLLVGALRGRFSPSYFTPVDLGGLYWHLVDLIWIFLFPLLYLI
jgi:cytochrome c oxidase subunit 3